MYLDALGYVSFCTGLRLRLCILMPRAIIQLASKTPGDMYLDAPGLRLRLCILMSLATPGAMYLDAPGYVRAMFYDPGYA